LMCNFFNTGWKYGIKAAKLTLFSHKVFAKFFDLFFLGCGHDIIVGTDPGKVSAIFLTEFILEKKDQFVYTLTAT